jgi:hypothetical protein
VPFLLFGLLAPVAVFGQSADDLFRGTWQLKTPEQGSLIILVKPQGLASYFWGDNVDRTVYQGSWTHTDSAATIRWGDGSLHTIERSPDGFTATYQSPTGGVIYSVPAAQLPREILGQWSKPPSMEDEMRSDRDEARGFFGIWKIGDTPPEYVFVEPDRSVASTVGLQPDGDRGEWAKQGSELHIIWDSGDYGILRETARGHSYQKIKSGQIIEEDESDPVPAARTIKTKVPSDWFAAYSKERDADIGGLAFSSRKVARAFYRGDWVIQRGDGSFESIDLARFGGLSTSADSSLDGQWTLSGQDVFMRWDDGMRKILSPVGRGFVLYEYRPGRPLDGVPTRVLAAAPANASKLAEHLKGRADVAQQMQQMASTAGIDPATQDGAGWGRTFARWVWPFGSDAGASEAESAETLLAEEYESSDDKDPWWWPFWSEKPDAERAKAAVEDSTAAEPQPVDPVDPVEVDLKVVEDSPAAQEAEPTQSDPKPANRSRKSAKDWLWPF